MRKLQEVAADFRAHRSVERAELVRLFRAEIVETLYLTDSDFTRLTKLVDIGGGAKTVLYSLTQY